MAIPKSTPLLLTVILLLMLVVLFLLIRPAPPVPPLPPMVIVAERPSAPLPAPATPLSTDKAYGATTLTYRSVSVPGGPEIPGWNRAGESLNTYYPNAPRSIPTDYTIESCPCPFRKPQKTDLPIPDIPICSLLSQTSYKLSEFSGDK